VFPDDTPESLAARVLAVEHRLLPATVAALATGALQVDPSGRPHGRPPVPAPGGGTPHFVLLGASRVPTP
jgi:hypothetical protein